MPPWLKCTPWLLLALGLMTGCSPVISQPTVTAVPTGTRTPERILPTATLPSTLPADTPAPTLTRTLLPPVDTIRDIAYVPGGATQQVLDLYLPPTGAPPYPAILLLHGGGGSKRDLASLGAMFARQGYVAASLNFRDFPGYTYPAAVQDAFCGLAWLHANAATYQLDPQRFSALGHSFGATLAAMLGSVDDPSLYLAGCPHLLPESAWIQGVVTFSGIFDYASAATDIDLNSYARQYLGSALAVAPEIWAEASPLAWVDGSEPAFLVIHGAADDNVPPDQSQDFSSALQEAGVMAELLLVPDADHFLVINDQAVLDMVMVFLAALFSG